MTNEWRKLRHKKSNVETNVILPAFNGYLFAVNALDCWKQLRDHQKIYDVLSYRSGSGYMMPYEIDSKLVERDFFQEKKVPTSVKLKPGSKVRIVDGPFTGFSGVAVSDGLVEIVLFDRRVKTKIPQHMLILIQGLPPDKKRGISSRMDELVDQKASD